MMLLSQEVSSMKKTIAAIAVVFSTLLILLGGGCQRSDSPWSWTTNHSITEPSQPFAERSLGSTAGAVDIITFVGNGAHLAYKKKHDHKWIAVIDGQEGHEFEWLTIKHDGELFSQDGRHCAYVVEYTHSGQDGISVVRDGEIGPVLDDPWGGNHIMFSPDGDHLAYIGLRRRGAQATEFIVLDGKKQPPYSYVAFSDYGGMAFSPDGKRLAYAALRSHEERKWVMVVDGQEEQKYDGFLFNAPVFSPDSEHVAYAAVKNDRMVVVLDGREVGEFDRFWHILDGLSHKIRIGGSGSHGHNMLMFSPDSERLAYVAQRGNKQMVVVDHKPGPEYDQVGTIPRNGFEELGAGPLFSPNSRRWAYLAVKSYESASPQTHWIRKMVAVIDGEEGPEYRKITRGPVFNPNSRYVAYVAEKGTATEPKQCLVMDNEEGPEYDRIRHGPVFSADGRHVAYVAEKDGKRMAVLDDEEGPAYDYIGTEHDTRPTVSARSGVVFSPDGRRWAYAAARDGKWFVVLDGEESPEYDKVAGPVMCRPDDRRTPTAKLLVDYQYYEQWGTFHRNYRHLSPHLDAAAGGSPVFSPDSRHVAYAAKQDDKWMVVMDGREGLGYEYVFPSTVTFNDQGVLQYIATRDGEFYRVTGMPPATTEE